MITLITKLVNFKHHACESTDLPGTGHGSLAIRGAHIGNRCCTGKWSLFVLRSVQNALIQLIRFVLFVLLWSSGVAATSSWNNFDMLTSLMKFYLQWMLNAGAFPPHSRGRLLRSSLWRQYINRKENGDLEFVGSVLGSWELFMAPWGTIRGRYVSRWRRPLWAWNKCGDVTRHGKRQRVIEVSA